MKHLSTIIISILIIAISCSNNGQEVTEVELNNYMDTVSYSVGKKDKKIKIDFR